LYSFINKHGGNVNYKLKYIEYKINEYSYICDYLYKYLFDVSNNTLNGGKINDIQQQKARQLLLQYNNQHIPQYTTNNQTKLTKEVPS